MMRSQTEIEIAFARCDYIADITQRRTAEITLLRRPGLLASLTNVIELRSFWGDETNLM